MHSYITMYTVYAIRYTSSYGTDKPTDEYKHMNLITLAAEFIYLETSAECAGPINRPTVVKGLNMWILIIVIFNWR